MSDTLRATRAAHSSSPIPMGRIRKADARSLSQLEGQHDSVEGTTGPETAGALNSFDVFSFIINKMVGTGIFTVPPTILLLTHSRHITLLLWCIGFTYAIFSTLLYLSFWAVLPYSTGELLYIDEATSYAGASAHINPFLRSFGNGLLAYTLYSFVFVTLFNNGTNTLQVGRQILISYNPQEKPNLDLTRFMGVVCLTIVCLLHYFSARAGRVTNRILCILKLGLMVTLLVAGTKRATIGPKIPYPAMAGPPDTPPPFSNHPKALLLVLFSFQGWENASFIAGEISLKCPNTLRNGFIWAVMVTGSLYVAINVAYIYAVDIEGKVHPIRSLDSFGPQATRCWSVAIAVSATGSLVAVIYTFARVKQAIGHAKVLPGSHIWKQDCPELLGSDQELDKTPKGGLILHWISAVVMITAVAGVKDTSEMIAYPGFLQTYGHVLVAIAITIGLPRLHSRAKALGRDNVGFKWVRSPGWILKIPIWTVMSLYVACGFFMVGGFLVTPSSGTIPRWVTPLVIFSLLLGGTFYYYVFFHAWIGNEDGSRGNVTEGDPAFSLFSWAKVKVHVSKISHYNIEVDENARRFGSRREITYHLSNDTNILYLLGGGTRADNGLKQRLIWEFWDPLKKWTRSKLRPTHRD